MPDFHPPEMHLPREMRLEIPDGPEVHIYDPARSQNGGEPEDRGAQDEVMSFLNAFAAMPQQAGGDGYYPHRFAPEGELEIRQLLAPELVQELEPFGADEGPQPGPLAVEWTDILGLEEAHYDDGEQLNEDDVERIVDLLFRATREIIEEDTSGEQPVEAEEADDA
ncbi:hypothetical protein BV20DRAFT_704500 [Pilatotrama ljubarskyi]|nr:hypothetical protein BV20DRAFT_704500 [Pilatotrama ljubarskyi]